MKDREQEIVQVIVELAENCGVAGAVRDRLTEREQEGRRTVAGIERAINELPTSGTRHE